LFHEEALELDYDELVMNTSLDSLVVKVPKYYSYSNVMEIKHRVYGIPKVSVRYDDDPYMFTISD
jgi:hypothetical protein